MSTTDNNRVTNSVKTVLGMINQFHGYISAIYDPKPETTINHKYGIFQDQIPTSGQTPRVRYFGIGINGSFNISDADGNLTEARYPRMTDMDLYMPIPFRCVPIDEDLTAAVRKSYRMRVVREINGTLYAMYYLKVIDFTDSVIQVTRTNPTTGTEEPYELDSGNLIPVPPAPSVGGVTTGTTPEVNVSITGRMYTTGLEVSEVINVLYGNLNYATISEIGLYTGEDKEVTAYNHLNQPFTMTEAMYVQLAHKTCMLPQPMYSPSAVDNRTVVLSSGNVLTLK